MAFLANVLIKAPVGPSAGGDAIWRSADLTKVDVAGIVPSDALVDEMLTFKAAGADGAIFARLVPGRHHVAKLVTHQVAEVRFGAASNPMLTDADLAVLAADSAQTVATAASTVRTERAAKLSAAIAGDVDAAVTIVDGFVVDSVAALLDSAPAVLLAALARVDRMWFMTRLSVVDESLTERICAELLTGVSNPVEAWLARWAVSDSDLASAALAVATGDRRTFRRRCTPAAQSVLATAGVLDAPARPAAATSHVPLDALAAVLEPHELAGLYFSTVGPVGDDVAEAAFDGAATSMLANFLVGQTARQPFTGQVRAMLTRGDTDRNAEVADAVANLVTDGEDSPLAGLPWAGELMLACKRSTLTALPPAAASDLFDAVDESVNGNGDAWEYLLAISEEWESTLGDLVANAAII